MNHIGPQTGRLKTISHRTVCCGADISQGRTSSQTKLETSIHAHSNRANSSRGLRLNYRKRADVTCMGMIAVYTGSDL